MKLDVICGCAIFGTVALAIGPFVIKYVTLTGPIERAEAHSQSLFRMEERRLELETRKLELELRQIELEKRRNEN